ncbi:MAG TPA: lipopolysaccharide transport periplasmic protein LptA [Noviherbaspirillum sp.]|nr:lipopolysaccharide transport periplasmic protein LptA [Noviherbaspirillum sp.]
MKRTIHMLLVALAMATGTAHAARADSEQPTNIEADRMVYDDIKQINTFTGNVVLTRGSLVMRAHRLVVSQDPQGYQYATLEAAPGGLATFRQKRDSGPDDWVEGEAERIEYNGKAETVHLIRRANMRRLEGTRPIDEVQGASITYDSQKEFYTVNNTAGGESKPGAGRIRATIQPRTEARSQ